MKLIKISLAFLMVVLITGCATTPQVPIAINDSYWKEQNQQLGIYLHPSEPPQLYMEGDVRLLDYAINAAAMSSVTSHFKNLDMEDYKSLRKDINSHFIKEGKLVTLIEDEIKINDLPSFNDPDKEDSVYFSRKDYSSLKSKYNIGQLLVIKPRRIGVARPYAGFIPMGDPRAVFEVEGELIDLNNNQLLWYSKISHDNFSSGNWDEPPSFPGLTNAFYTSLEAVKQGVMQQFERKLEEQAKLDTK